MAATVCLSGTESSSTTMSHQFLLEPKDEGGAVQESAQHRFRYCLLRNQVHTGAQFFYVGVIAANDPHADGFVERHSLVLVR